MALTFGIYPGGLLGDDNGIVHPVRPDLPDRITDALDGLQGTTTTLSVRAYQPFAATVTPQEPPTPADPQQYLERGRKLDLVLPFREPSGRLDEWLEFVREAVRTHGPHLASLQICEEPNADLPVLDGSIPNVLNALVQGVVAAKQEARALGHTLAVGFNAVPTFDPADTFWSELAVRADARFLASLDYVGLDFFPDVFRPIAADQLAEAVTAVLTAFRRTDLPKAAIPDTVPIRICENGWPTGPDRPEQRQAAVVESVVRTVATLAPDLNIDGYSFFALRDADSGAEGHFHHFGLLRDDYTPKPAFETYRRLINELGNPPAVTE
ncbi:MULTISPECIES: hypothetical protein [Streptomyces]|jgi:hypothetical protein|uniref:Beta-glucosidase n=1 Tax=Streptomyces mirabilis TaxID=68239 RepID=A0ABU3V792_9ACTN|nr:MULTISPECIES: hypothetical protein [Streptomyces]MCX4617607.1 hypothetical protein [Streptomyces mirabilis]MCX5356917.1 hypothetical protein [Streptomyces mirabilis]MDU9002032.1 hypothetical protein [Streptomyces mirabilis]QDO05152.1 hypothetical protein FNV68_00975 [Streptomyces sp. S1D4-23]